MCVAPLEVVWFPGKPVVPLLLARPVMSARPVVPPCPKGRVMTHVTTPLDPPLCRDEVPQATASNQSTQTDLPDLAQSEAQTEVPTVSVS